jgi:hypothetical protein
MLTPARTKEPTIGKAMNAGISVTVPKDALMKVANSVDSFATYAAISAGGINVISIPTEKTTASMLPIMPLPNPKAILKACLVLLLSFMTENRRKRMVIIQITVV